MPHPIFDARLMLRVKSPEQLKKKQHSHRLAMREFGLQVDETIVNTPVFARIEANRWLFDCVCGSGVAVHPDWPEARCMGDDCGRVYTNVQIPAERAAIEAELLKLPPAQRYWYPGEAVEDVQKTVDAEIWDRHTKHAERRKVEP